MHFLVDVHLPIKLSRFLDEQENCSSVHVNQILQKWHTTDAEISKYADKHSMVVVTKDTDFKNTHFINKSPKSFYIEVSREQITIIG
jgi:predicted nuclease of predicted toxin-antitoxin system